MTGITQMESAVNTLLRKMLVRSIEAVVGSGPRFHLIPFGP